MSAGVGSESLTTVAMVAGDLHFSADLSRATLKPFRDAWASLAILGSVDWEVPVGTADFRLEGGPENPGSLALTAYLPGPLFVRLLPQRLEVSCSDLTKAAPGWLERVVERAVRAYETIDSEASWATFGFLQNVRLGLEGATADQVLDGFLSRKPEGLGRVTGCAVVFTVEPEPPMTGGFVALDSLPSPEGTLGARLQATCDAAKLTAEALGPSYWEYVKAAFAAVGLAPAWTPALDGAKDEEVANG